MLSVRSRRRLSSISARSASGRPLPHPPLVATTHASGMGESAAPIVSSLPPPVYVWAVSMSPPRPRAPPLERRGARAYWSAGSSRARSGSRRSHRAAGSASHSRRRHYSSRLGDRTTPRGVDFEAGLKRTERPTFARANIVLASPKQGSAAPCAIWRTRRGRRSFHTGDRPLPLPAVRRLGREAQILT